MKKIPTIKKNMLFKEAVLLMLRKMKYRNLGFEKCVFVLENPTFEDSLEVLILKIILSKTGFRYEVN